MNRIENIILTLATAAALLAAGIAKADPTPEAPGTPCPETGAKNNRPVYRSGEAPEDGLNSIPRVKTPTGTRLARDLELEEANRDSGMKPVDGLEGRPVVKTPTGTRTTRDLEAEQANRGHSPCPEDEKGRERDAGNSRINTVNEAGSLLKQHKPKLPDIHDTKTKEDELANRNRLMDSLKDAANQNQNKDGENKEDATVNTTMDDALRRAGIDRSRLDDATTETHGSSTKITLADGTVIWTGPDSDGYGTSVTKPNGDQVEVYPDGRVSTRQGRDGDTITHHPGGTTTFYDPNQETLTVVDRHGRTMTRPLDFYLPWFDKG